MSYSFKNIKMKTKSEINSELIEVQKNMDILTEERETAQVNLISLKARLADGMLPNHHYKKIIEAKVEYKNEINGILKKYRVLKSKKQELNKYLDEIKLNENPEQTLNIKENLQELKDKYFDFYRDKTRIAYMRNMAKDFIIDLDKVIKQVN